MLQDDTFISDEDEDYCPLCVEEMDITDKNFKPCPCGYQICQFCYNNIRQNPELNGKCPACRRAYEDKNIEYKSFSTEEWKSNQAKLEKKKRESKQREKDKKDAEQAKRHHLAGMRVIQKNLVYVVGLNPNCSAHDLPTVLRSDKYFGQYGKILKLVINKRAPTAGPSSMITPSSNIGYGVYVTFARKEDASNCIAAIDGSMSDGRVLRAAHGTTKYCSSYLRGQPCPNPNCMFLHEPGEEADSYTRQDLSTRQGLKMEERSATNGLIPPTIAPVSSSMQTSATSPSILNSHLTSESLGGIGSHGNSSPAAEATPALAAAVENNNHHNTTDEDGPILPQNTSWAKSMASSASNSNLAGDFALGGPSNSSFPTLGESIVQQKPTKQQQATANRKKDKKEQQHGTGVSDVEEAINSYKVISETLDMLNSITSISYSIRPSISKELAKNVDDIKLFHPCNDYDLLSKSEINNNDRLHMASLVDSLLFAPSTRNYGFKPPAAMNNMAVNNMNMGGQMGQDVQPQQIAELMKQQFLQQQAQQQSQQPLHQPQPLQFQNGANINGNNSNANLLSQQALTIQQQQQFLQQQVKGLGGAVPQIPMNMQGTPTPTQINLMKLKERGATATPPPPGLVGNAGESMGVVNVNANVSANAKNSSELLSHLMGARG